MPNQVVFSDRAFTALLAETKEKITTETGGIFLGIMHEEVWYIIETIDPGPKSIFQMAYFEYDGNYVRHLANKINRLYGDKLDVLGLWHRHPGSMDTFSSTDDGTIKLFCEQNGGITISALVNIDPKFRLTMYSCTMNPHVYKKINYEVSDRKIPQDIRDIVHHTDIEKQINSMVDNRMSFKQQQAFINVDLQQDRSQKDKVDFINVLAKHLQSSECYTIAGDASFENSEDDYNSIIEDYLVDECLFCDEVGISYACDRKDRNEVEFIIGKEGNGLKFSFYMLDFSKKDEFIQKKWFVERIVQALFTTDGVGLLNGKHLCFINNGKLYLYKGDLLKRAWEGYLK